MKETKTGLNWKIVIIVIILGLLLFNWPSFVIKVPTFALSKRPETYTELYFTDHLNLPKQLEPETQYEFEFSVHNLEYKDFTYVYEITATDENGEIILDKGQFLLKHDEVEDVGVTFQIPESFKRIKISVNLVNKNQIIHFWGERKED